METEKENKRYTLGKIKISGYNLYSIWDEKTNEPIKDYYAFELGRKAKTLALKELKELNKEVVA